jgi:CBS domain-containing protein
MIVKLDETQTVGDLIRRVAIGHERTLLIVNDQEKLIGVVTQGDILRAIWNGAELGSPADRCINYNPLTLTKAHTKEQALSLFAETGALVIPVIDELRKVIEIVNVRELMK